MHDPKCLPDSLCAECEVYDVGMEAPDERTGPPTVSTGDQARELAEKALPCNHPENIAHACFACGRRPAVAAAFQRLLKERNLHVQLSEDLKLALKRPGVTGSYVEWAAECRQAIDERDALRTKYDELVTGKQTHP